MTTEEKPDSPERSTVFADPKEVGAWERLSPISIVYFFLKFTITSIRQGFVNAIPAFAAFAVIVDNKLFWLSIALPSLVLAVMVFGVLYYWNFRFQIRNGEILIHRGVLKKEKLNLQYSRVQNVNISRPFYFAPFKLVNCIIESAGSKTSEVDLPGVSEPFAESVQSEVFATEKDEHHETSGSIVEPSEADGNLPQTTDAENSTAPMLKLSNLEAAKSGLTSYLALIVLAAFAPFFEKFSDVLADKFFPYLLKIVEPIVGDKFLAGVIILVTTFVVIFLIITSASVIGALIRFYNFELYNKKDKLVRKAGLLERKTTTLTKSKIQSVAINQNLIAKALKRVSLQYRQVGVKLTNENDGSIQIPMLEPQESSKYVSVAFQNCPDPCFQPIHRSYIKRVFLYFNVIPFIIIFSPLSILVSKYFLFAFLGLIPIFGLIKLSYKRYGFWHNHEFAAMRSGLLGHRIVIFPLYKIQMTKFRQSRGQRRRKVGNLTVQLGSGVETIPYLKSDIADRFINLALYKTESSNQPWM